MPRTADFIARLLLIVIVSVAVIGFLRAFDPGLVTSPIATGIIATVMAGTGWIPLPGSRNVSGEEAGNLG